MRRHKVLKDLRRHQNTDDTQQRMEQNEQPLDAYALYHSINSDPYFNRPQSPQTMHAPQALRPFQTPQRLQTPHPLQILQPFHEPQLPQTLQPPQTPRRPPQASQMPPASAFPPSRGINHEFHALLDAHASSLYMQNCHHHAVHVAPRRFPNLSNPDFHHSKCLFEAHRDLVAIFRSRGPVIDDEVSNPHMSEAVAGPMTEHVWSLVYELVDFEQGIGDHRRREQVKYELVEELVRCVVWDVGMDGLREARSLVEDLFPLQMR